MLHTCLEACLINDGRLFLSTTGYWSDIVEIHFSNCSDVFSCLVSSDAIKKLLSKGPCLKHNFAFGKIEMCG